MVIRSAYQNMSGPYIYSHDVSPAWVKQGYHWLYECTLGPIERLLKLL